MYSHHVICFHPTLHLRLSVLHAFFFFYIDRWSALYEAKEASGRLQEVDPTSTNDIKLICCLSLESKS